MYKVSEVALVGVETFSIFYSVLVKKLFTSELSPQKVEQIHRECACVHIKQKSIEYHHHIVK